MSELLDEKFQSAFVQDPYFEMASNRINNSVRHGKLPKDWKLANVTPSYKDDWVDCVYTLSVDFKKAFDKVSNRRLGGVKVLTDATSDDHETPTSQIEDPAYPDQLAQESLTLHTLASPEDLGVHVLPPSDDVEGLVSAVPSLPSAQLDETSSAGNSVVTDDPAEEPELPHPDQIAQESQVGSVGDGLSTPTVSFPSPVTASSPHPSVPSGGIEGVAQNPHFPPNQYPQDVILATSPRFFNPHGQAYYPFPGPDGYPAIDPYRFYDQQRFYDQLRRPVDPSKIPPRRTSYNPHPVLPSTIFAPPERPIPLPPRRIKTRQPVNVRAPLPRPTPQTPTLTSETSENQSSSETDRLPDNDTPDHTDPEAPKDVTAPFFQPKREQWNSKIFFEIEQSRQQLEEAKQQSDTEDSASLPHPEVLAEEHSKIGEQSREERPEEGPNTKTSTEDRPKPSSSEEDQENAVGNAEIPIHDHENLSPLVSSAEKSGITIFPQDVDEVFQFEGSERDVSAAKPNGNRFVQLQPTPTDLRDIDASLYEGLRLPYYSILDEPAFPNGNQQIFEALENVDPSAFNEAVLAFEPQRTSEAPVNEVGSNIQQNLGIPIEPVTQVDTGIPATTPFNNQPQPSQQNLPQLQANSQFADFYDPGFLDYINALYRAQAPDYDYFYDYDSDYNIGSTGQFPGNQNSLPPQLQGGIPATTSGQPSLPPTGSLFNPWGYPLSPTSPTRGSQTGAGFPQQFFPQNIPFPTGFPAQGVIANQTQAFPFNPLGFQQQGILPFGYTPTPTTFVPGFQSTPQIPAVSTPRIRFQDDTVLEIRPSPNPPVGVTNSIEIQTPPSITFETSTSNPQMNENGKTDNESVSGVSQATLNSLLTTNQTQVIPQQNLSVVPPPSTFASPVQVPLPNDSLPTVSQELIVEQSGGLGGNLGSVVPVKKVSISSPNQPQNLPKGSESVKPHTATSTLPKQNIPEVSEITLNNVPSIPAVLEQNTSISSGNLTPNVPTQDKTSQAVQFPSTVPAQAVQLPDAFPTQNAPPLLAIPTQGIPLSSPVPPQDIQRPITVPSLDAPSQNAQLPSAVPTQGIPLLSVDPTQDAKLYFANGTQGLQLPSTPTTQNTQLPINIPPQNAQQPLSVQTQNVQIPSSVPIQGAQRPPAVPTQGVQLPSAVPTQGVQLPSAVPTQGVQLPSAVPTQDVQFPSAVSTQGVQLPSALPTQGVQLPSALPTQGVQLPSTLPTQGVQLPSVPTQGVQLPSVPTQGVQLPSALPTQDVQLPSALPTQGVQLPSAVPTQGVQLPSAVPTQGVQLPSVPTQGVQLPSAVPTQGVQLPSALPTQGVQLPSAVLTQGVQLPSAVPTQSVQLPSAVPTQGVQLPSVPTQGVQLPSVPTQGVQLPSVPTQGVQLPSAVPTQGVQLPSAVPFGQQPSVVSTQYTPLTFGYPTQGIQSPTVSSQFIQLPALVPTQNLPPAVPVQSKRPPSVVSAQGIQLPSAFPTLSSLVPVRGSRPPSAVPTQPPSQRVPVPSEGAQILSGFLGSLSQTTSPPSGFSTSPPLQDLQNTLLIPLSPVKGKSSFTDLPGKKLPEITQVEDKINTIGNVVTRPPLSVLTARPPTAVLGNDPIRSPATGSPPATPTLQTEAFNDFMNFFGLRNGDETSTLNPTTTRGSNEFAVGSGLVVDSKVLQDLHKLKNVGPRQDTTTRSYPLDPSLLNSTRLFANLAEAIRNTINPSYFILTKHDVGNYSSPPLIRNSQHKQSINRLPAPKSVSETGVPDIENSSLNSLKGTQMNAKMPHLIASLQAMMDKSPKQPQDSEEDTNINGKNKNEKYYSTGNRIGADEFLLLFSNKSPILPDDGEYIILIPRPTELKFPTDSRPSAETTADIFTQGREFLDFADELRTDKLRADGTIKPHSAVRRRAPAIDPAEERIGPISSSGETEDPLEHPVGGAFYGLSTDPGTLNWLAPYSGGFGLREPRKGDGSGERTEKKIDDAQTNSSNLISNDYADFPLAESNTLGLVSPPTLLPEDLQSPTLAEYYAKYFSTAQDPQVFFNPLATGSYPAYYNNSPRPTISGVRSPEQFGYFYQGQYPQFNLGVRGTGANPYDFALANFPTAALGQDRNAYNPNQTPQETTPADNIGNRAPPFPESVEEGTSTTEPNDTPDYAYDAVEGLSYDYKDSSIPDYLNGGNLDYSSDTAFDSVYSDYDVQLESNDNSTGLTTTNPLVVEGNIETGSGDTFSGLDANVAGLRVNGGADVTQTATQRPDFPTIAISQEAANASETVPTRNKEDFDFNSDVPVGDNVRYDQEILDAIISGEVRGDGIGPSGNIPLDYVYIAENIAPSGIPLPPLTEVPATLPSDNPETTISTPGIEVDTDRSSFSVSADGNSASGLNNAGSGTSGGEDPWFTNIPVDILVFTAAPTSGFQPDGLTPDDNIFTSQTKRVTPDSNIFTSLASRFTPESNMFTSQGNVFTPSNNAFTTELSVTTPIDSSFIYKNNNFIPEDNNFTPTYSIPITEGPIIASFDVVGTDLTREGPLNAIPTVNPISNDENDENISQDNASGVFESTSVPVFETTTMTSPVFETTTESAFETTTSVPVIDTTPLSLPQDLIFPDGDDNTNASFSNGISTAVPDVLDAILHVDIPGNQDIVFGGEVQLDQNQTVRNLQQGFSGESQTNMDIQGNEEVVQTPSDNLSFPQVPMQNESPAANQQVTVDEKQQASKDTQLKPHRTGNANETSQNAGINSTADVPFTNEQAEREESSGIQISAEVPLNTTDEQTDTKDERPNLASQLPFLELPEGAFGFTVTLGEINNTQSITQENIDNLLQNNTKITTEDIDDQIQNNTQSIAELIDNPLQNSAPVITENSNDGLQTATQNSTDVSNLQTEETDVSFRQGNDTFVDLQSNDTDTGILIIESTVEDTVPLLNIPGRVEPSGISSQTPVDVLLLGESGENIDSQTSAKGTQGDSSCNDTGDLSHNAELTIDFSSSEEPIILLDSSVELASIEDRGKDKNQDFVSLFQDQLDAIRKGIDTRDKPSAQAGKTPDLPVPSVAFTGFGEKNQFTTNVLSPTPAVQKVTETTTTTVFIPIVKPTNSPSTTKKVVSTLKGRPTPKPGIWRPTFGLPVQTQTSRPTSLKGISNQPSLASFLGGSTPPASFGLYGNYNNQQSVGAIATPGQGQYTRPSSIYDNASQQQNLGTYSESQGQTQKDNEREKWVWRNSFSSLPIRGREENIKNRPLTYNTNNFASGTGSQGGNHYAGSTYDQNKPKHTEYGKDSETDRWVWTSNRSGSLPTQNPPTPFPIRNTWVPDNYLLSPSVVNYVYSRVSPDTSETPVTDSSKKLGNRVTQPGPTTTTTPYYWYSSHSHTDPRVSVASRNVRSPPTSRHH
ncbi:mucin-17-like [Penaeus monodon]|uniref:mucin-17-like n=1 Tax=Penaeus monodon TaxID=6687 RepID=UPI0018A74F80|nr:mucin-17-like [Penaeus monodon]